MELSPGLAAAVTLIVTIDDTALALRSGDVAVLATPRVVALVEEATVTAVARALDAGQTTVGTRVELDHLVPTRVGGAVVAHARLAAVDGRRLSFEVTVTEDGAAGDAGGTDGMGTGAGTSVVARGRVDRVIVDRARFLARAGGAP
jgi:predicted thioesterase